MAGGGLYALVAYGTQNVILSGNPQMTYFYKVFKRYSHFAMENITIALEGPNEPSFDATVDLRAKIPRYGDLMSDLIFSFYVPDIYSKYIPPNTKQIGVDANSAPVYRVSQYEFQWVRYLGLAIINRVSFSIGGQKIQEFDGSYMLARALLDSDQDTFTKWRILVGDTDAMISPSTSEYASYSPVTNIYSGYPNVVRNAAATGSQTNRPSIFGRDIHVPLSFWFSDAISKALPLIGLQYHECEIRITLNPISKLYTILDNYGHRVNPEWQISQPMTNLMNNTPPYSSAADISGNIRYFLTDIGYTVPGLDTWQNFYPRLQANFIYLPREEQIIFATRPLSYIITQVTTFPQPAQTTRAVLDLQPHNPLTRMIFLQRRSDQAYRNDFANFTNWYTFPNYPFTVTPGVVGVNYSGQLLPGMQQEMIRSIHVLCDGNEIQETKNTSFFTSYSVYKYVKGLGQAGLPLYSFQLENSPTQPSGSINASRIRNFQVDVDFWPLPTNTTYVYDLDIYVENINFLEIVSGMGGLKYAL
jgi:hypothetical protein